MRYFAWPSAEVRLDLRFIARKLCCTIVRDVRTFFESESGFEIPLLPEPRLSGAACNSAHFHSTLPENPAPQGRRICRGRQKGKNRPRRITSLTWAHRRRRITA